MPRIGVPKMTRLDDSQSRGLLVFGNHFPEMCKIIINNFIFKKCIPVKTLKHIILNVNNLQQTKIAGN